MQCEEWNQTTTCSGASPEPTTRGWGAKPSSKSSERCARAPRRLRKVCTACITLGIPRAYCLKKGAEGNFVCHSGFRSATLSRWTVRKHRIVGLVYERKAKQAE